MPNNGSVSRVTSIPAHVSDDQTPLIPPPVQGHLGTHTVSKTIGNLRDVGSAILTGEGAGAFAKTDNKWQKAAKVGATLHTAVWWNVWHSHLAQGRVLNALKYFASSVDEAGKKVPLGKMGELGGVAVKSATIAGTIHGYLNVALFLKRSYDLTFDAVCDVLTLKERNELFNLIKSYDPIKKVFNTPFGQQKDPVAEARIKELLQKKLTARTKEGGNYMRSPAQRALDWGAKAKDAIVGLLSSSLSNVGLIFGQSAVVTSALSLAGYSVKAVNDLGRGALQMANLNNIRFAEKHTLAERVKVTNPDSHIYALHQSIIKHMRQERVYTARANVAGGASAVAGAVANGLALGAAPVAVVGTMIASGALVGAVGAGTTAFNLVHGRTLLKRRENGEISFNQKVTELNDMTEVEKTAYYDSLGEKEKIGEAERMLLHALRHGSDAEKTATVEFLLNVGISAKTIKTISLAPDEKSAYGALTTQLHTARLHIKGRNLVYLGNTVSWLIGINYFKDWLHKREERRQQQLALRPH